MAAVHGNQKAYFSTGYRHVSGDVLKKCHFSTFGPSAWDGLFIARLTQAPNTGNLITQIIRTGRIL
jgi:hypothetical protein